MGGFDREEEPIDVGVVERRPCSYRRGDLSNAREAAELKYVDEALTAAHVGTVALVIHKHVIGIPARRDDRTHVSASREIAVIDRSSNAQMASWKTPGATA